MTALDDVLPRLPDGAGPIALLSSHEFTPAADEFDRLLLSEIRGPRIAVIVAAQGHGGAAIAGRMAVEHYKRLGADPVVLDVIDREDAEVVEVPEFDLLFMSGGSPRRLLRTLRGTPLWERAVEQWRGGAAIGGSSAGAMVLCEHCLIPKPGDYAPTSWTQGLGLVPGIGLAVHATERSPEWLAAIKESAEWPVLALGDATGSILTADSPHIRGPNTARVL